MSASVLVVDDDGGLREAIADALADEGMTVTCSSDGLDALRKLRAGLRPDVILLDLMMPNLDGWGFRDAQLLDPALSSIPVVVLTAAHTLPKPIDARAVVRKPFKLDELLGAVRSSR